MSCGDTRDGQRVGVPVVLRVGVGVNFAVEDAEARGMPVEGVTVNVAGVTKGSGVGVGVAGSRVGMGACVGVAGTVPCGSWMNVGGDCIGGSVVRRIGVSVGSR